MIESAVLAIKTKEDRTYGALAPRSHQLFSDIEKKLAADWTDSDSDVKRRLDGANGCLDKLGAFLMQVHRMKKYHDELLDWAGKFNHYGDAPMPISNAIVKKGAAACADFEGTILQARASLDRLTWFVSRELGQKSSSYTSYISILESSNKPIASQLLKIARHCKHLELSLIGPGNPDPLRDFVAHKGSASEIMAMCFSIYYFGENLALICDCELGDNSARVPILATTHRLNIEIAYLVLNSLAAVIGMPLVGATHFNPNWQNRSVVLSDYFSEHGDTFELLTVNKMTPSGYQHQARQIRKSVLDRRVPVPSGSTSFSLEVDEPK